jgi:hypothetical protein
MLTSTGSSELGAAKLALTRRWHNILFAPLPTLFLIDISSL